MPAAFPYAPSEAMTPGYAEKPVHKSAGFHDRAVGGEKFALACELGQGRYTTDPVRVPSEKSKTDANRRLFCLWRRERDSNPRYIAVHLISSQSRYPDFEGKRRKLTDNARVCKPLKNQHFFALDGRKSRKPRQIKEFERNPVLGRKKPVGEKMGRTRGEITVQCRWHLPIPNIKIKVVIRMTESMKYYESIRRKYPETVSKDQFYQIAHISKATALHLLQNGLVPCKDTGKKTRRYTIRTDDIIFYMIDRELHPEVYRAPDRWYQERSGHYNSRVTYRNELTRLSEEERASFRKYMEDEFCQYGDLLTVVEVAEAIGYCDTSLHRWCNAKKLKSFNISGKFLIPKISLVDFLVSQYSFDITRKTWKHTLLIKNFLDQLSN